MRSSRPIASVPISRPATRAISRARLWTAPFVWGFETPRGMMRYTITLDAQGRWSESGERSADGQTWQPFFAMTLDRIK